MCTLVSERRRQHCVTASPEESGTELAVSDSQHSELSVNIAGLAVRSLCSLLTSPPPLPLPPPFLGAFLCVFCCVRFLFACRLCLRFFVAGCLSVRPVDCPHESAASPPALRTTPWLLRRCFFLIFVFLSLRPRHAEDLS